MKQVFIVMRDGAVMAVFKNRKAAEKYIRWLGGVPRETEVIHLEGSGIDIEVPKTRSGLRIVPWTVHDDFEPDGK